MSIEIFPVTRLPEIQAGDDIASLIVDRTQLRGGDIVVVAQKVVSKAEGQFRDLHSVVPSAQAAELAARLHRGDPRFVQVVLDESVRIVRAEHVLITETKHGFVCANAGVDQSNVPGDEIVTVLPQDPDASANRLRESIRALAGAEVGVIISDTHGRPWRLGICNVALGSAGLPAMLDYRGQRDDCGRLLSATVVAIVDELAAAAELVMGKTARAPVAVIRGYLPEGPPGRVRDLMLAAEIDLFR